MTNIDRAENVIYEAITGDGFSAPELRTRHVARALAAAGLLGSAITAILMMAAQLAAHEPAPAPTTTTVTTTVTTPVAPCDGPDCPPWPSLDY